MRTLRGLALVAAGLIVLTGCGSGGGGQTAANDKQTITVWGMGAEGEKLGQLAHDFETANPNITVKVTPISWDVAHQKLVTAVAGNQTPDVSQLGTTWMGEFGALNALEELGSDVAKQADFFPGIWNTSVVNGKTLGVPWYVETRVLFYRTDLATKAGIGKPPATWEQLRQAAQAMKQTGGKYGISLQPGGTGSWQQFLPFVWQDGGELISGGKLTANTPQFREALAEYQYYFANDLAPKSAPPGFDVTKAFAAGEQPMFFSGPWVVGLLQDNHPEIAGKWAIAPVPGKSRRTSFTGGSNLVVFKNSKHKAAAKKFVSWLASADTQTTFYGLTKDLPANKASWKSGTLASDPNLGVFRQQLDDARSPAATPKWEEIASKVDAWVEKLARGDATPEQASTGIQNDASALIGS